MGSTSLRLRHQRCCCPWPVPRPRAPPRPPLLPFARTPLPPKAPAPPPSTFETAAPAAARAHASVSPSRPFSGQASRCWGPGGAPGRAPPALAEPGRLPRLSRSRSRVRVPSPPGEGSVRCVRVTAESAGSSTAPRPLRVARSGLCLAPPFLPGPLARPAPGAGPGSRSASRSGAPRGLGACADGGARPDGPTAARLGLALPLAGA
mmetsp:Transcript_2194/g.6167  ORF Transcript_2194/g.6167 Transcript_2194/m.6167 type:complete len:206 (+) Transcript_2194:422-1039(+)